MKKKSEIEQRLAYITGKKNTFLLNQQFKNGMIQALKWVLEKHGKK